MKVLLYSRYGQYAKEIEDQIKKSGLEIVDKNPDVVITHGGDGTILGAERDYPGIPKLPLRNSTHCHLCSRLPNEEILKLLIENKLKPKEFIKLQAEIGSLQLVALNDIVIAHKIPNLALRYKVNDGSEMIGDGLVIATPFGSTGYFNSITHQVVTEGFGLAYNNVHPFPQEAFTVFPETGLVKVEITRGPGVLAADNDPQLIDLNEGDKIFVRKFTQTARILLP